MSVRRNQRPWRKRNDDAPGGPGVVFTELQKREMRDLETCRKVWEQEQDPLALCEAVRQCAIPDWLRSSLLLFLTDSSDSSLLKAERLWEERRRHAIDATRAAEIAGARSHPDVEMTWEMAYQVGERFARDDYSNMPMAGLAGAKKSYHTVRSNLALAPYRYYRAMPGMQECIRSAWAYFLGIMQAALDSRPTAKVVTGDPPTK